MRALVSVFKKDGLVDFMQGISPFLSEIYATGKTFKLLTENGITAKNVSEITGFEELLEGRVKTLHPGIFSGILSKRDQESEKQLSEAGFVNFDLVVSNLYPFEEAAKKGNLDDMIENIDIGGVSLIRAAAKNFENVTIVTDPSEYETIAAELKQNKEVSLDTRKSLALKAFARVAEYDINIYNSLYSKIYNDVPENLFLKGSQGKRLRYGENPDQLGYLFSDGTNRGIANAIKLQGKELSYNNILDANSALETVLEFEEPTVVIMKHNTPCGVSSSSDLKTAFTRALDADRESAYGSVIAVNRKLDLETAKEMSHLFIEVLIIPDYEESAIEALKKRKNLRILKVGMEPDSSLRVRSISNGFLVQSPLRARFESMALKTSKEASRQDKEDLEFAWKVVAHCRSNAIVLAKDKTTTGIGAGQTSRIEALRIASERAGEKSKDSVLASDAYFPFDDNVSLAGEIGVSAIIQPGGSIRDQDVISKSEELGIPQYFTGKRVFLH